MFRFTYIEINIREHMSSGFFKKKISDIKDVSLVIVS